VDPASQVPERYTGRHSEAISLGCLGEAYRRIGVSAYRRFIAPEGLQDLCLTNTSSFSVAIGRIWPTWSLALSGWTAFLDVSGLKPWAESYSPCGAKKTSQTALS